MPTIPLLPEYFIQTCDEKPDEVFCHVVKAGSDDLTLSFRTWSQLIQDASNASDRLVSSGLARRLPGDAIVKVAVRMRDSYDGFVAVLGIWLNRWTPVFISPRLSAESVVELVRVSGSQSLLVDESQAEITSTVISEIPSIAVLHIKDIVEKVQSQTAPRISLWKEEDSIVEADNPLYFLHTSGSTGHPKLIPETHRSWWKRVLCLTPYPGRVCLSPLPVYHTAGLGTLIRFPFGAKTASVITESDQPFTGELFCRILEHFSGAVTVIPPAILQEIATAGPSHVQTLATAHRVMFVGAPLAQSFGDQLAEAGVKLMSAFGTTEVGQLTVSDIASEDPRDWQYVRFLDPNELHMVSEPGSEGLYRMVVKPGRFLRDSLINSDDPVGFSTGDLWEEHPTKPGLWKHMGRRGSVTVLSNGEKTDNSQLESLMTKDPTIQHALVFGEGRFQNGVLLLPSAQSWDSEDILRAVWPTVESANAVLPQHSRLVQPLVIVADPQKRFALSDKGTIRRQETLKLYTAEIEAAYAEIEAGTPSVDLPNEDDPEGLKNYIRRTVCNLLKKEVADDADVFKNGMDSLMALTCRSNLLPLCKITNQDRSLPRNLVYHRPSINALYSFMTSEHNVSLDNDITHLQQRLDTVMQKLLSNASNRTEKEGNGNGTCEDIEEGFSVVLTGSTGTFGSQLLTMMLRSPKIRSVHCLLRTNPDVPSLDRQKRNLDEPNVLYEFATKLKFWDVDLAKDMFGLDQSVLSEIRRDVTQIVHCAWDVNFNHPLDHFLETQIVGVQNIIDLALSSQRAKPPRIVFLSSVSAVSNYAGPEDAIPEIVFDDASVPLSQGYGQAKFLAERMLAKASEESSVPVTIIRAGQLSGSTVSGAWNTNEHIPILLRSSMTLQAVPSTLPDVRWIPTDIAAEALLNILLHDAEIDTPGVLVRHLDGPHVLLGSTLVQCITDASGGAVRPVSVDEWLQAVKDSPSEQVPANRLLEFYTQWLDGAGKQWRRPLDITNTSSIFDIGARVSISPELVAKYFTSATSHVVKP